MYGPHHAAAYGFRSTLNDSCLLPPALTVSRSCNTRPFSVSTHHMVVISIRDGAVEAVLLRIVAGEFVLAQWARRAHSVHCVEWRNAIATISGRLPHARTVTLLECDWIDAPCTWGTISPTVLLPRAGVDWSAQQRELALVHELAHVRRFDAATHLAGRLACAMHWYNPMVWSTAREALMAQEEACDDAVLSERVVPSAYATLLMDVCKGSSLGATNMNAALGLVRATGREIRMRSVLDAGRRRFPVRVGEIALVSAIGATVMCGLAAAAPAQNRAGRTTRSDSTTIAEMARRACAQRVPTGDTSTVGRFTFRTRPNQGPDSTAGRIVQYSVVLKGCGKPAK